MGVRSMVLVLALLAAGVGAAQAAANLPAPDASPVADTALGALSAMTGGTPAGVPSVKGDDGRPDEEPSGSNDADGSDGAGKGQAPADEGQESGDSSAEDDGEGSGGQGQPRRSKAGAAQAYLEARAAQVRAEAQGAAGSALSLVPEDPVGFLDGQVVRPVQDKAEEALQVAPILLGSEETPAAQEAAPQAVAPVARDGQFLTGALIVAGATATGAALVLFWMAGSSGTVGAAGAGAAAGKDLRRLLPFASPLFTRFERDTVLGHPKREALYSLIMQHPGISLQALGDATGLSRTAVNHHLRLLELQHLVVSRRMGRSRHYYENGGRYQTHQKEAYALLQNDRSRAIARYVADHPGTIQRDLCGALGLQASIAHWHVKRLVEAQLVEPVRKGRTVSYFPGQSMQAVTGPSPVEQAATPILA